MRDQLEITRTNRKLLAKIMDNFSLEDLNKVPQGFNNNLIWNIAHVVVTQQLLTYKLSGLPMMISDEMIVKYRKGTKTEGLVSKEEVEKVKELLFTTIDKTEKDIDGSIFEGYQEYPTSTGFVLKSVEDAINFNNFHEGIHLGYILALKKSL
ncbi:DinB family protein [Aquimarina sp. MMG015]|uniref:DinB family protein n=1 Tax=Aquimarina TaxID=290174 RepID=UPI000416C7FD|nr:MULTISPECIES: DinB family protein [Aquimarina]AXT57502.1 DinB family protein [Aquimarina sp. AD1]MBQ4801246.1 DinB family protein [Aquimarina sp. MMG015]RKN35764.1 DinB family protein [Aquimarina sp. AD1]